MIVSDAVLDQLAFNSIKEAIEMVRSGKVTKVEGPFWKVYRVSTVIRIDIYESSDKK